MEEFTAAEAVRVLVCDPRPVMREGLLAILERDPRLAVIGTADDLPDALAVAEQRQPKVMVVNHDPPALDGIEVARRLTSANPSTSAAILLLIADGKADEVLSALQAGARALLPKDVSADSLASAIHNIASGGMFLSVPAAVQMLWRMVRRAPPVFVELPTSLSILTNRELDVLMLVARGYSNRLIAAELSLSEATVKSHLYHLCQKLDLRDRTQAAVLAYETGLVRPA